MKKSLISSVLLFGSLCIFAQKSNVSKAKNSALMENPDFVAAREYIKLALQDESTKNDANTWYVAGLIGYSENDVELFKPSLLQESDPYKKGTAILESYNYFIKAYELDNLPDAKGKIKPRFSKEIKTKVKGYYKNSANLFAYGAKLLEDKNYVEATKAFDVYLSIPLLPMMNNEIKIDSTYNEVKFYNAYASEKANLTPKAINLYEDLKDDGYREQDVYHVLYELYVKQNDTVKYISTLKEGFSKFPDDTYFLENIINHYAFTKQYKEAINYLDNAISQHPKNADYYRVKGSLSEIIGNNDQAKQAFEKAIELNPKMDEAYAGIGRIIYNEAYKMSEAANKISVQNIYEQFKKTVDAKFSESIPYFQKAYELNPKEMEYKRTLRILYYRLKMNKEYEAIQKDMNK